MRFVFKTDYDQDIRLLKHSGYWWSYGVLLALLIAFPYVVGSYLQSQIVFVFIYAIVGVALIILTGFTGQASLGHAAFLAIGAYTAGFLQSQGISFIVYFPAAAIITGAVGAMVGFPALRLSGIYLVIATIAFAFIVEEILARWESVTHGNEGMRVRTIDFLGQPIPRDGDGFYFLCLLVLVGSILLALNLLRSPKSMGIDLARYKVKSFAISAALTGMAGVLFAHKMSFISPEMFTLLLSIEFIMVIIIGGAFGVHGAVLGAIFIVMVDPFLTTLKDDVPVLGASLATTLGMSSEGAGKLRETMASIGSAAGLKGAIYGLIIMMFILFEPYGLYGRWLKVKLFFQLFPLYKKATFKRQKTYVKSERNR